MYHIDVMRTIDKLLAEVETTEEPEGMSDVTVACLAREFGISKKALNTQLEKRSIRTELVYVEYFSPQSNAFISVEARHLLVWQVELAIEIAHEIKCRSDRRPSMVKVRKVA